MTAASRIPGAPPSAPLSLWRVPPSPVSPPSPAQPSPCPTPFQLAPARAVRGGGSSTRQRCPRLLASPRTRLCSVLAGSGTRGTPGGRGSPPPPPRGSARSLPTAPAPGAPPRARPEPSSAAGRPPRPCPTPSAPKPRTKPPRFPAVTPRPTTSGLCRRRGGVPAASRSPPPAPPARPSSSSGPPGSRPPGAAVPGPRPAPLRGRLSPPVRAPRRLLHPRRQAPPRGPPRSPPPARRPAEK